MKTSLLIILLSIAGVVSADEVHTAKIERVRVYTTFQAAEVRNFTVFTIDKPLLGGCSSLYISPNDKEAMSLLLMSKAQNAKVLIGYQETLKSPWDSATCPTLHIEIM